MGTEGITGQNSIDLLGDLMRAAPEAIHLQALAGGLYNCRLDIAYEVATPQICYRLSGAYHVFAEGIDVEIELIEEPDLVRSVIYVKALQALYLFVPEGSYRLCYRFLLPPGAYLARLGLKRVGVWDKLVLYATKIVSLLRRGPTAVRVAMKSLGRKPSDGIVAMRMASGPSQAKCDDGQVRPVIQPVTTGEVQPVSIIIPTKDRFDLLRACIDSLSMIDGVPFEVVIIDNGATRVEMTTYLAELAQRPEIKVIRCEMAFNFSRLCNAGAVTARHPFLLFLNDDVEALDGGWLGVMQAFLRRPDVGAVGARLLYPSGDLQHGGLASHLVPGPGHPWRGAPREVWQSHALLANAGEVDAVTAACLLMRRNDFETVGGFDEDDFAITLNDVDLCLKLRRRGLKSVYVPEATLLHKEGQSREPDDRPSQVDRRRRELKAYFLRYPDFARNSCFYPPDLRRDTDQGLVI